jgi:hypothetical protein
MSGTTSTDIVMAAFAVVEARDERRLAELYHPEVEFHWPRSLPYGGSFRGAAALQAADRMGFDQGLGSFAANQARAQDGPAGHRGDQRGGRGALASAGPAVNHIKVQHRLYLIFCKDHVARMEVGVKPGTGKRVNHVPQVRGCRVETSAAPGPPGVARREVARRPQARSIRM